MKTILKTAALLILAAVMLLGVVSCKKSNNNSGIGHDDDSGETIIGTWSTVYEDSEGHYIYREYDFHEDGKVNFYMNYTGYLGKYGLIELESTYTLKGNVLSIRYYSNSNIIKYRYELKNGHLYLYEDDMTYDLEKGARRELLDMPQPTTNSTAKQTSNPTAPPTAKQTSNSTARPTAKQTTQPTTKPGSYTYQIQKFSTWSGIAPSNITSSFEIYNKTVSVSLLKSYTNYLLSCGYVRDTATENEFKNDYEYIAALVARTKGEGVTVTYASGVGIVGYGADCVITGAGITPTAAPTNTGRIKCPICNGAGKVKCSSCDGKGYLVRTIYPPDLGYGSTPYEEHVKCAACEGTGKYFCTHCSGTGYIG